jgi:hypothetical protein
MVTGEPFHEKSSTSYLLFTLYKLRHEHYVYHPSTFTLSRTLRSPNRLHSCSCTLLKANTHTSPLPDCLPRTYRIIAMGNNDPTRAVAFELFGDTQSQHYRQISISALVFFPSTSLSIFSCHQDRKTERRTIYHPFKEQA